jgi:hypothetical protein
MNGGSPRAQCSVDTNFIRGWLVNANTLLGKENKLVQCVENRQTDFRRNTGPPFRQHPAPPRHGLIRENGTRLGSAVSRTHAREVNECKRLLSIVIDWLIFIACQCSSEVLILPMKNVLRFRKPFCECKRLIVGLIGFVLLVPLVAWANADGTTARDAGDGGASAVWIFANLSFAGMRAQNSSSRGWRIVAFIFGFPGTLLSLLAVREGSERAYGIEMPRRKE